MLFWISAGALAAVSVLWMLRVLLQKRNRDAVVGADPDIAIYRDQLAEIDRDLARGLVSAPESQRLRTEIQRRVLEADRAHGQRSGQGVAPLRANQLLLAASVLVAVAGLWLYLRLGAPAYQDYPLAERLRASADLRDSRPTQAEAEASVAPALAEARPQLDPDLQTQIAELRRVMQSRPDDLTGQGLLAQYESASGDYVAAAEAQSRVIALKGEASSAEDHAVLANLLILAAGGLVTEEAEAALTEALRRDPANGAARYYSGLLFAQIDRPDLAFRLWRPLYETSAADAPWMRVLPEQLDLVAEAAGVAYRTPAPALAGPDQADIAAAAEMSAEDRSAMIAGMVDRLSARLATEGRSADEWAQLIRAYGVLGQVDQAESAWQSAKAQFAASPDEMAKLRAAAEQAGVSP